MLERLRATRERGYDSALDELDFGIVSIAVPVFDADRRITCHQLLDLKTTRDAGRPGQRAPAFIASRIAEDSGGALQQRPYLAHSLTG
ncbi:MAG: IclR family transcriptional regulator C-terminal domain-containing protein [Hyphomonadaceae bacterium]